MVLSGLAAAMPARADASPQLLSGGSLFDAARCGGFATAGVESSPSVAVDPRDDRHVAVAWSQDRVAGVQVAVTRDGGESWERSVPDGMRTCGPSEVEGTTEPRVALTRTGVAYAAALVRDELFGGAAGRVVVSRSADGGTTWASTTAPQGPAPLPLDDFDDLAADPDADDGAYVLWNVPEGAEPMALSHTTDGGRTWRQRPVRTGTAGSAAWARLVALGGGRLVIAFVESPFAEALGSAPQPAPVLVVRSSDGGATWSAPVEAGRGAAFQWPGVAVAPDGDVHLTWVGGAGCARTPLGAGGGTCRLLHGRSQDAGGTWPAAATVVEWSGPWVPTPAPAVTASGAIAVGLTVPQPGGASARAVLATSRDCGTTWDTRDLTGPFPIDGAAGEAHRLGLYSSTGAAPGAALVPFVQTGNAALHGPADVFLSTVPLLGGGGCQDAR